MHVNKIFSECPVNEQANLGAGVARTRLPCIIEVNVGDYLAYVELSIIDVMPYCGAGPLRLVEPRVSSKAPQRRRGFTIGIWKGKGAELTA